MKRSTVIRTGAIGTACALVGAGAGIAGSSASSPSTTVKAPSAPLAGRDLHFRAGPLGGVAGPLGGVAGPPVHSDAVVPNEKGGFDTITMDRGRFSSVSGATVTITEGTKTATYKTVTLKIPSGATIRRNGQQAQLSDLKSGDTVIVVQGPKRTLVAARDAQHQGRLGLKGHLGLGLGLFGRRGLAPRGLPAPPREGSASGSGEGPGGAAAAIPRGWSG